MLATPRPLSPAGALCDTAGLEVGGTCSNRLIHYMAVFCAGVTPQKHSPTEIGTLFQTHMLLLEHRVSGARLPLAVLIG